jgi:Tol biopolymer transport system component
VPLPRFFLCAASIALALVLWADEATARALRTPVTNGGAPAVSPDGSRIAFLSDRGGATDLYVISADGAGERRLTRTPEAESQPDWSGDGKEIWFTVFAGDSSRIFSIEPDGGHQRLLGTVPGRAMRISPDGKRALSWIGTWTAMRLFVSDLDGSGSRQLTDGSGVVWGARWSPEGKRIAFADKDSRGLLQIEVMNADGSGRRTVTHLPPSDGGAQMPSWSPDGAKLAVQASAKGQPGHIWIVDISGGAATKLAAHDGPYQDEVPTWFPDGRRIAFQSDRTGRMEIWVMNADGSGARQVTK